MEKSELTDSLNQESTLSSSPGFITSHHDPQVVGKLTTAEKTDTDNEGIAPSDELKDHSTLISTKVEECPKIVEVVNESSSEKTNDDTNRSSDSESSESDKEHKVTSATKKPLESSFGNTNDDSDHNSDSESSESDKEHKVSSATRQPMESFSGNTNNDSHHNSDSESSSDNEKEHEVNFVTKQSSEKEADIISNDLKQPISTTVKEYSNTEVVYESAIKNTNDDMDHSRVSESFESDKEQEVFNSTTGQPLEKESDLVTNDLKQSPLINTTIEEHPRIDEVVYVSGNRNTIDDMGHKSVCESFESDKEREVSNFDVVTDDLKQSPLINTIVEECSKTDIVANEFGIKNINDDMDNISESTKSDKEHEIFNFATGQSSEKETDLVTNDLKQSPLISMTVEECPKINEVAYESDIKNINDDMDNVSESTESDKETDLVTNDLKQSLLISTTIEKCPTGEEVYESAIMNTNNDMDHGSISESSVSGKEQAFNFAAETPKRKPDIVTNDMEQLPLQKNLELVKQSSSNDEGHNSSSSHDDLQEEFSSGFNIVQEFHRSISMESVESLDGSNVSEIEGESIVDRLKRQVEYDKKCINSLYNELEEERNASEVAVSQAMAMITRLQEEKSTMHMEALHYLRMMEEQAEYDVEALEKANELLNEKDRDIQELEAELEYYRSSYMVDTIAETEHEKSDSANEENITPENDIGNDSFKSTMEEPSKGSYMNNQNLSLEFEDEKIYIQLCLKGLEDEISKIFTNGQQKGEESIDAERSQGSNEENDPSKHIDQTSCNGTVTSEGESVDPDKNGHFGYEESSYEVKDKISCANKREEVDFLALERKISELAGRLEALQADYDFLEHSLNSLRYGEEGLQFAQNIVNQLQELCKLGIRLDRKPGS